jgi:uncharacterized protein (TIGR03435 family)
MKKELLLFTIVFTHLIGHSQTNSLPEFPVIGRPMPYFELTDIQNFNKKKVTLNDFKGKWLVLDWWTRFCPSCVESFPKVDKLQNEFGDKVQFLYVSYTGNNNNTSVREIYSKAKQKLNLTVPFAFDSLLYQKYNLGATPYIVVIDPKGVVRGLTTAIVSQNIKDFIEGKQPVLRQAYRRGEFETAYNSKIPFLTSGGPDTNFIFRSLISKWRVEMPKTIIWTPEQTKVELLGQPLESLIFWALEENFIWGMQEAQYGKTYPRAVLEVKDSSIFNHDYYTGEGIYNYSLIVKKDSVSKAFMKMTMQRDLESYFNISISVESRKMPYWKLTAVNDEAKAKLKTRGGEPEFKNNHAAGFVCKNCPMKTLMGEFDVYYQDGPPFIDETGIDGNIDISINALLTDLNDFKRALNENGLDLQKGEKQMKVLVIKDKN